MTRIAYGTILWLKVESRISPTGDDGTVGEAIFGELGEDSMQCELLSRSECR
jgi:hypothetical protein